MVRNFIPPDELEWVPDCPRAEELFTEVSAKLVALTPKLNARLEWFAGLDCPEELWQIDFEIHDDHGHTILARPYAEGFNELMWLSDSGRCASFLDEITLIDEDMDSIGLGDDEDYRMSAAVYIATAAVVHWFAGRWSETVRPGFDRRATIGCHDAGWLCDLQAGGWREGM